MKQQPPPSYQVAMSSGTVLESQNEANAIATNTVALPPEVPLSPPPYNVAAESETDTAAISADNQNGTTNAVVAPSTVSGPNPLTTNQN